MPKPGGKPAAGGKGAAKGSGKGLKGNSGKGGKGGKGSGGVSKPKGPKPPAPAQTKSIGQLTSHIGNKQKRSATYAKLKHRKQKDKKLRREKAAKEDAKAIAEGREPEPKQEPKTIESTRDWGEGGRVAVEDLAEEHAEDEFASHFAAERPPNVLLTTNYRPSKVMYQFLADLLDVFPAAQYYKRSGFAIKKICTYAAARGFTDLVVVNEDRKQINGLLVVHLPEGPTAHFRLSKVVLSKDIKGHGRATAHKPELIMSGFGTKLGHRVGRLFSSLFCQDPAYRGRRVVTFHNQRDFIFFRHHRYIFEEKEQRKAGEKVKKHRVIARLQELGPRFVMRLTSLQKGTFDSKHGEFEWEPKNEKTGSRRKFNL
mmetsp:Transcript_4800/g.13791  ORF Transcript_4800/g.13791 Transcript_4800/m.13791 type:complete len:370 (-) Transcript_4800:4153-5262(-)